MTSRFLIILSFLALPLAMFGQRKTTAKTVVKASALTGKEAMMSSDVTVIAGYLRANPGDPEAPALRSRILELMKPARDAAAKASIQPLTPAVIEKQTASTKKPVPENESAAAPAVHTPAPAVTKKAPAETGVTPKIPAEQAARMVNHLLNGSKNSREALIQITNNSSCDLLVRISGRQFYNLTVPARGHNYIMVEKGTYDLTTSICDARYSSKKTISQDLMMTLSR